MSRTHSKKVTLQTGLVINRTVICYDYLRNIEIYHNGDVYHCVGAFVSRKKLPAVLSV